MIEGSVKSMAPLTIKLTLVAVADLGEKIRRG
jgi:hypothetical protein